MIRRFVVAAIMAVSIGASPSVAGAILLASYDYHIESGGAPLDTPQAEFIIQLAVAIWEPHPTLRALGGGIFWGDGDSGTRVFTSQGSSQFSGFQDHATNGIEEIAKLWNLDAGGGGASFPIGESSLYGVSSDLIGNDLTEVRLTVHSIHFEPFEPIPGLRGYTYVTDITWSFHGVPVPEPATMMLLIACILCRRNPRKGW